VCMCVCLLHVCVYVGYNPNKHIVLSATVCKMQTATTTGERKYRQATLMTTAKHKHRHKRRQIQTQTQTTTD